MCFGDVGDKPAFGWDGHAASSEEDEGTDGEVCLAKQKKGGRGRIPDAFLNKRVMSLVCRCFYKRNALQKV